MNFWRFVAYTFGAGPLADRKKKRSQRNTCFPAIVAAVLLAGGVLASSKMAVVRQWLGLGKPAAIQLVVLPFATADADSSAKAFSNGLTETLTAELTHLTGNYPCKLSPPVEVRAGAVTTVEQARKEFEGKMVLEGSLHGAGDRMRVTYSLVECHNQASIARGCHRGRTPPMRWPWRIASSMGC